MVVYLFFGILLLAGLILLGKGFVRAKPGQVIRALKIAGFVLAAGLVLFLLVSGRLTWALMTLPVLLPWLLQLRTAKRLFKAARGPSQGQASRVETPSLSMELDHDTGEMDGTILAGPLEGRRLSDLDPVLLVDLYRWCVANDDQAARLLEAYLDRELGAEWRDEAGGEAGAGGRSGDAPPPPGGMSADEALSILGLEPGASDDEIRAAHRRLMRHAHPDRGGSAYLAAKVNAAKDVLLGQKA